MPAFATFAGEHIVHLETKLDALQASFDEKSVRASALETELETVRRCLDELNDKYAALRRDATVLSSEKHQMQRQIESTPGLQKVPEEALSAIRRAQNACEGRVPSLVANAIPPSPTSPHSPSLRSRSDRDQASRWSIREWLLTTKVVDILSEALLRPLTELLPAQRPGQLAFVRALADARGGLEALVTLLSADELRHTRAGSKDARGP